MKERSLFIVGAAGEGIQTIGDVVARCFLMHGYPPFAVKEYESRIRGGNNSYRIRVADAPRNAPRADADVLLALNSTALAHYGELLRSDGLLISSEPEPDAVDVPFQELAVEHGGESLFANAVAAGALCAAVGLPFSRLERVLSAAFARRGEEVLASNVRAARAGFDRAADALGDRAPNTIPERADCYAFASAHETIPIAAAAAGCRFISAYPMSPSTGIITAFARKPELGVFVEQAEDEIAAIQMALGASAAGARAMTATSGGGFALMIESLSLAGMIETLIVIVLAQRPGPATGLPTRTAQEDLLFAIHAGHGEFPRLVLAPADPQDAIAATVRGFELADRYQIPVIVLTDQFLADAHFSLPPLSIPAGASGSHETEPVSAEGYACYALTGDGISPRLFLGHSEHLVCLDSDEHTEAGHITEDLAYTRPVMVEKRLEKGRRLQAEVRPPEARFAEDAEIVLIGWGSTRGAIAEAVDVLRVGGRQVGSLHFTELWPLPWIELPDDVGYWVVEGNATGQFARLLAAEYGVTVKGTIGRYDGLPIDAATLVRELS